MNYDIELNANDNSVLETQYAFTQGDYGQIQFSIRVKADGAYVTNAQRAYIVFTLPNGYVVTGADMSKSVATYTYPFQGSELQVPGIILADVKLVYTNGQISSNKFSFICRYDPLHDKSFEAGPYISQLQQIVDDGHAKIDYLQSLIEILQTDVGGTPVMRSDLHNTRDAVTAGQKAIDANMAQNILLKGDVTHQNEDNANKIVAADSLYAVKANLQSQIDTANSNLKAFGVFYTSLSTQLTLATTSTTIPIDITGINDGIGNYTAQSGVINISQPGTYIITGSVHGVINPQDFITIKLATSNPSTYEGASSVVSNANAAAQQFLTQVVAEMKITTPTNVYLTGTSAAGNASVFPQSSSKGTQIRIQRVS